MQAHVLIVDDDEAMRDSLLFSLESENKWWTISVADGAPAAREIIQSPPADRGPVDVVLTDLVMGETGSGIDVLEAAKAVDPFMMVIVFTAQEKELDRFEAYKHGAFDCVEKNMIGKRAWKEISVKANAAINFRRLAQEQLENQRKINMLQSFFDPRVFEAVRDDPKLLGVRMRAATVVFWDLRGFSLLCERLKEQPAVLREFMFEYYTVATEVTFRNRGIVDKLIGDGVMALFMALRPEDDDGANGAAQAVTAALDLLERFAGVLQKWQGQLAQAGVDVSTLGLGCGIHTGHSLVGNLGTATREQFTALGPHVNFAARLEAVAKAGQILVSKDTAQMLSNPGAKTSGLGSRCSLTGVGYIGNVKNLPGQHGVYEVRPRSNP